MNNEKRAIIDALITITEHVINDEKKDLKNTPDSIEFSSASDEFRKVLVHLETAVFHLNAAKNVTHKHE